MKKFNFLMSALILAFFAGCGDKISKPKPGAIIISTTEDEGPGFAGVPENRMSLMANIDKYIGTKAGGDCSGFITVLNKDTKGLFFDANTLHKYFSGNKTKSQAIFNFYNKQGKIYKKNPRVGDLIFFSNTTSRTKHKTTIDDITHVGIVREIYDDGRVRFVHYASGRDKSDYMNMGARDVHKNGKRIENSYISHCRGNSVHCLTSHKFAGYGRVDG